MSAAAREPSRAVLAAEGALIGVTLLVACAVVATMALEAPQLPYGPFVGLAESSPLQVALAVVGAAAFAAFMGHALDGRPSGVLRGWAVLVLSALAAAGTAASPQPAAAGVLAPLLAAVAAAALAGAGLLRRRGAPPAGW